MTRERFNLLVAEALDTLPERFRVIVNNLAVVVEDVPPGQPEPERLLEAGQDEGLLMGEFVGIPTTQKSVWDSAAGPDRVVLYQRNIEAFCETEAEIREQVRLTVLHELGHYFGMDEEQLEDV